MRDACASSRVGSSEVAFPSASMARACTPRPRRDPASSKCRARYSMPELLAPALGPPLVAVLRQELSGVEVEGRPVGRWITCASGACRSLLEGIDVHPKLSFWAQDEVIVLQAQVAVRELGAGSRTLRAACTTWRRLFDAALLAESARGGPSPARDACDGQEPGRAASRGPPPSSSATRSDERSGSPPKQRSHRAAGCEPSAVSRSRLVLVASYS